MLVAAALALSCGPSGGERVDAGAEAEVAARARALLDPAKPLPSRPEVIASAQFVEANAEREGAGARANELHMLAASVLVRLWRVEGKEQDAKEAIEIFKNAARDGTFAGGNDACDAAIRGAKLAGEIARDAEVTYRELYRTERRFIARTADGGTSGGGAASEGCVRSIEVALAKLAPFRPPSRVLEAIDQGLAGQGAIAFPGLTRGGTDASVAVGQPPRLMKVEPLAGKDSARVVLLLDRPARFRPGDEVSSGGKMPRTFIELDGVDVGALPKEILVGGIVTHIAIEATTTGARVTMDLDGRAYRRVFHLVEPYRIVIDVARNAPGQVAHGRREVTKVALDPGHGGNDPGAIGPSGVREKDVTLGIAHKVAPILAKDGISVVLTRDDDRFVPLEERTARANASTADLFVSIHCNAADNRARHGVETYVLDTTKDEIAARVAARENATSQAATNEIGGILASMRMADQATHSTRLAELLQKATIASLRVNYTGVTDGGVKTAGFYVLVGARMPSVLFETSYISNAIEEQQLGSDDYTQRLADAIANAVKAYREGR